MKKKTWLDHIFSRLVLPYNILKCKLFGIYKPLVVLLYATDRCNLNCIYCRGHWSARKIPDLTTEEIIKIVDESKELGTCHFTIHGGEILLRDDVKYLIDYMKDKNLYVNLVTNGILLAQNINEIRNIDSLCISLDGSRDVNDVTRGKGTYEKILSAIKLAKKENFKLNVHATLTKYNKNDIGFLVKLAREIGYYQQFSILLKPWLKEQIDISLDDEDIKKVLKEIISYKKQGYPIFTSIRTLENVLNWKFPYSKPMLKINEIPKNFNIIRCFYGKLKIVIDANGFVYPCSSLNQDFQALNVKEVGVKAAYEHILKTNTCESCIFLTQNDWNLLLGFSLRQYLGQIKIQLKEIFNI